MFRIGMKESRVFRQKCYSVELGWGACRAFTAKEGKKEEEL